ncbi:hypothetical protein DASC09_030950 [Saccharomycopsis crataegensis]|uniref:Endonuclease n=1 Tax=Saccharomycopsis crataegensis TaxID=43959 RepID=A0AAV5QLD3_9ASCO|nr:hypothetical protein DASC09_030950 [Saccharomycopsis crataegensis]
MKLAACLSILNTLLAISQAAPINEKRSDVTDASLGLNAAGWFTKYGYPGPIPQDNLLVRDAYVTAPNYYTRNPYWSVEHINADAIKVSGDISRDKSTFREDTDVPEYFRSKLADYKRSGYDRGHQAPAGDVQFAQDALDQTFYLSNMCPQVGVGFNRNYWAWTEEFGRNMTGSYDSVRILTGPLYLPTQGDDGNYYIDYKVIGNPPNVHVPTHFFKVIIGEDSQGDSVDGAAFVLPNEYISESTPLTNWQTSFQNLTSMSGLEILTNVTEGVTVNNLCDKVECRIITYSHTRYNP